MEHCEITYFIKQVQEHCVLVMDFIDGDAKSFKLSYVMHPEYIYFPSLMIVGLLQQKWYMSAEALAVCVKNRIADACAKSGLTARIVRDVEGELVIEIVQGA